MGVVKVVIRRPWQGIEDAIQLTTSLNVQNAEACLHLEVPTLLTHLLIHF